MRTRGSNGNETRRNLRTAAVKLLFKHGYENMNLRMLAKSIGIRVGSLYNYFDSKQGLLFWLLTESHEKLLLKLNEIGEASTDPDVQMRRFIAFHLGYLLAEREEATVLSMEAVHRLSRKNFRVFARMQREYTDKVCAIVQKGTAAGKFNTPDAQLATFAVITMLTAVVRWYKVDGKLKPDQVIDVYTDLIFAMLGATVTPAGNTGNRVSRYQRKRVPRRSINPVPP
jgi:AcrR family transcriptional regulator